MRRSEAKDEVMVREDYQHRIKFGSFKSRYIAKQRLNRSIGSGVCMGRCNARTFWKLPSRR